MPGDRANAGGDLAQATRLADLLSTDVVTMTAVGGGDICDAHRVQLADDTTVFVKSRDSATPGFFQSEAAGLDLLRAAKSGVPVPGLRAVNDEFLALDWVATTSPSARSAERFGRALAATHRAGADHFGAARDGWIGPLVLPNKKWDSWPQMWAEARLYPFLDAARSLRVIADRDAAAVESVIDRIEDLAGPDEGPSLIHGDLWAGNVLWGSEDVAWLIDPATHGGHRETDLAMLALFGAPRLDEIMAAYNDVWPLTPGWKKRVALHQLHPVLVHAVLFGGSYGARAGELARSVLNQ